MDLLICRLLVQALDGERIGRLPHGSVLFYNAFSPVVSSRDSGKGSWVSRNMTDATKLPYQERYQTKNATCGWRPPPSGRSSPGPPRLARPAPASAPRRGRCCRASCCAGAATAGVAGEDSVAGCGCRGGTAAA